MTWFQLSIEVENDLTEVVTATFDAAGALSVTLQDAADEPLLEPAPGEQPLWEKVRVLALFPSGCEPERIRDSLRDVLPVSDFRFQVDRLEDRDWSNTWRDDFHAMCFGNRLWVCPSGESASDPDAVVVRMDPGLAFGTGAHTTTALCLEWLGEHPPTGRTVIDFGCGSGILAVAACKLGAESVRGADIDPQALQATRNNAARNGMEQRIVASLPDALDPRPVDLVIANILANPLIELAGRLARLVCGQGRILLTGILAEQADDVMSAYQQWFDFRVPVQREEWVLLEGIRRSEG